MKLLKLLAVLCKFLYLYIHEKKTSRAVLLQTEIVPEAVKTPGCFVQVFLYIHERKTSRAVLLQKDIVVETVKTPGCFVQVFQSVQEKNFEGSLLQTEIVAETIKAPGCFVQVSLYRQTDSSAFADRDLC